MSNSEIISVRINRKSIMLNTLFILAFAAFWFFITGQQFNGNGIFFWVIRLAPLMNLYQPVTRLFWGLTVNMIEGKFTYCRFGYKTEEFFRQDIVEAKRTPVSANGVAEEFLTIRTAKLSLNLRCSSSGINGFLNSPCTNVQELTEYLGV